MMHKPMRVISLLVVFCLCHTVARGELVSGRPLGAKTFSLSLKLGQVSTIQGEVQETKRAGTDIPGWEAGYGQYLENYNLEELGFDQEYLTLGLVLEKRWRFVTLEFEASHIHLTTDQAADRDYYLSVDEVSFGGRTYEYMAIAQGQPYDGDIQGGLFRLRTLITPVTLTAGSSAAVTPWIHLGIFSTLGHYVIDAGPAQGVIQYEIPPHEYVVGGKGEGWVGIAIPEIGLGSDVKLAVGATEAGPVYLLLRGGVAVFEYNGSTKDIGISARQNKALELSYLTYELSASLEVPLSRGSTLLFALGFEHREADASLEAVENVAIEKYDKDIDFEMERFFASIGLIF